MEPVFVEGIVDEYTQSVTESLYRPVQRQVMDKDVAEVIRQMLVGVVEEGLGRKAAPRAGGAGGKTGTAQTGRYQEDGEEIMDAWFVGFYPAEDLDIPSPFCWTAAHTTATTLRRCSPK